MHTIRLKKLCDWASRVLFLILVRLRLLLKKWTTRCYKFYETSCTSGSVPQTMYPVCSGVQFSDKYALACNFRPRWAFEVACLNEALMMGPPPISWRIFWEILRQMSGFADRILWYFAIFQQMSGFADRIFGYFAILLQVELPGTGPVSAPQILIARYSYFLTLFEDIYLIFDSETSDIFSHDESLTIGYSRIFNPGYRRRPYVMNARPERQVSLPSYCDLVHIIQKKGLCVNSDSFTSKLNDAPSNWLQIMHKSCMV